MRKKLLMVGKCIGILFFGGVIGTLLLVLFSCIPVNQENIEMTRQTLYLEGKRPKANALYNQGGTFTVDFHPAMLDNGSDSIMLENAFAQGKNPLYMVMDMNAYPRYWHGYFLVLRPLLYFLNYNDLRILNGLLQTGLVLIILFSIRDVMKRKRYILVFATAYVLLTPLTLSFSLQYSWVFYIAFGGILFAIRKREFLLQRSHYIFFFLILGMLTSYFDLLTFPLITWGFPLLWWLVASGDKLKEEALGKVISSGIAWIGGYGGFWLLKWVIATPILGYNVITDGMEEVFFRVGGLTDFEKSVFQAYQKWETLYCNWRYYEFGIYAVIIAAWMLWAVYNSVRYGWRSGPKRGAFLLVSLSSVVWYLFLSNHTIIHAFFTYRIFGVGILGFLCFLMDSIPIEKDAGSRDWKGIFVRAFAWLVLASVSLCFARLAREDTFVTNGGEYREVPLQEGEVFKTTFVPTFDYIIQIGFCLKSEEGEGKYNIDVRKDSEVIYHLERPLSDYLETTYHVETVYWNLQSRGNYQLELSIQGSKGKNYILMTSEGQMPLSEYKGSSINEMPVGGQLVGSFLYHGKVCSKWKTTYAALMWMVFLGAVISLINGRINAWNHKKTEIDGMFHSF